MTTLAGHTLAGRYRVDALIGRGGMADVYRGIDVLLGRPVAIKILTGRDERERERFLKEARAMAQLNHRAIVAVYDAGVEGDWSFIVMELVDGRTLAAIPASPSSPCTARCATTSRSSKRSPTRTRAALIHRDVKPSNVMVLPNGAVKVMDFGLARNASEMSSVTNAGEIVGTIAYLPPERFLGKPADERGDLYSVGIMLYETFTGTLPFKSESDDLVAVIFGHVNEPPPLPRSINRAVPPQVERIVMKLLEKEPDRRYQSAAEVVAALQSLLGPAAPVPSDPALQQPPSAGTRAPDAAQQGRGRRARHARQDVRQIARGRSGLLRDAGRDARHAQARLPRGAARVPRRAGRVRARPATRSKARRPRSSTAR